jgi:hypothetical protein
VGVTNVFIKDLSGSSIFDFEFWKIGYLYSWVIIGAENEKNVYIYKISSINRDESVY